MNGFEEGERERETDEVAGPKTEWQEKHTWLDTHLFS